MVEHLKQNGWEVTGTDLEKEAHAVITARRAICTRSNYSDFLKNLGVEFIRAI